MDVVGFRSPESSEQAARRLDVGARVVASCAYDVMEVESPGRRHKPTQHIVGIAAEHGRTKSLRDVSQWLIFEAIGRCEHNRRHTRKHQATQAVLEDRLACDQRERLAGKA
jgi:hypothetical protein